MSSLPVKICGITRPEDAALAARLGAVAVGMVFVPDSRRFVCDRGRVREIVAALPAAVRPVALFFNPQQQEVERVLGWAPNLSLQFQGEEAVAFCAGFDRPYIKGVRMAPGQTPASLLTEHSGSADFFLFDAFIAGVAGGSGESFDWQRLDDIRDIVEASGTPWFLAGGVRLENLDEAMRHNPPGLDLASGVEKEPGIKDEQKMIAFFDAVAARW